MCPPTLPISQVRSRFLKLADTLAKHPETGAVAVTKRGKAIVAVMNWDLYESIMETMEIMGDKKLMADFRRGVREMKRGKGIPIEKVKAEFGL